MQITTRGETSKILRKQGINKTITVLFFGLPTRGGLIGGVKIVMPSHYSSAEKNVLEMGAKKWSLFHRLKGSFGSCLGRSVRPQGFFMNTSQYPEAEAEAER